MPSYVAASPLFSLLMSQPAFGQQLPWMDTTLTAQARTELLLRAMTLDQKILQIQTLPRPNEDLPGCGFTEL
jgi:beta-glucosidase